MTKITQMATRSSQVVRPILLRLNIAPPSVALSLKNTNSFGPSRNFSSNSILSSITHAKMSTRETHIIIGSGVIGLTTALELKTRYPASSIKILASHLPGDRDVSYASPWAGANWLSVATDNGRQEGWDRVTYKKFEELADHVKEAGVKRLPIRAFYDSKLEDAGVLSEGTGKIWYEKLAKVRVLSSEEMKVNAPSATFGYEAESFVINVQAYLPW